MWPGRTRITQSAHLAFSPHQHRSHEGVPPQPIAHAARDHRVDGAVCAGGMHRLRPWTRRRHRGGHRWRGRRGKTARMQAVAQPNRPRRSGPRRWRRCGGRRGSDSCCCPATTQDDSVALGSGAGAAAGGGPQGWRREVAPHPVAMRRSRRQVAGVVRRRRIGGIVQAAGRPAGRRRQPQAGAASSQLAARRRVQCLSDLERLTIVRKVGFDGINLG